MASSANLAGLESWSFRSAFSDPWINDGFDRDTEMFTKALQKSMFNTNYVETFESEAISPFVNLLKMETVATPTVSGLSASEPETVPKRQRNAMVTTGPSRKVSKRKARSSKRSQTTFIMADQANFRQMVQQVTGVRFGGSLVPAVPILRPEPQRPGGRLQGGGGWSLPTLDTSAFLLENQQQQQVVAGCNSGSGTRAFPPSAVAGGGGAVGFDFDAFASFPTLESWKVT